MTKYEYKSEQVKLNDSEAQMVQMGMLPPEVMNILNARIEEVINEQGADGWEALYPFSMPTLWFRRVVQSTPRKRTARKATPKTTEKP